MKNSKQPATPGRPRDSIRNGSADHPLGDIEMAARTFYLEPIPGTGYLQQTKNKMEVLRRLKDAKYKTFIRDDTGKPTPLSKDSIKQLITQALKKYPVNIETGERYREARVERFNAAYDRLKRGYKLKELRVASNHAGRPDDAPPSVGKEAASMFQNLISKHGNAAKVGIGGGRTIRDMALYFNAEEFPITVCATNYATRIPDDGVYDSSYLAMHVHWLCKNSRAEIVSLPPLPRNDPAAAASWHSEIFEKNKGIAGLFESSLQCDVVFLGAGNFNEKSPSISRVFRDLGVDYEKLSKMSQPPVGDINLCFFDAGGNDISGRILKETSHGSICKVAKLNETFFKDHPDCHPFLVGMNIRCLKDMVEKGKTVVLVAGGKGVKVDAIRACLGAKIVNALVTDEETMNGLLARL